MQKTPKNGAFLHQNNPAPHHTYRAELQERWGCSFVYIRENFGKRVVKG